jgi:hypothetical protein
MFRLRCHMLRVNALGRTADPLSLAAGQAQDYTATIRKAKRPGVATADEVQSRNGGSCHNDEVERAVGGGFYMSKRVYFPVCARVLGAMGLVALAALLAGQAPAQTTALQGRVRNGTSNGPVAGAQVQYVQLQEGMTPVASTVSDAQGNFRFENLAAAGPALLRVEYQGATYSQPVLPQQAAGGTEVVVYDATSDRAAVTIVEHVMYLHPEGGQLGVIEQLLINNESTPPRAYVNPKGTYLFSLPGTPQGGVQASIEGTAGMPIPQTPEPRGDANSFAITYPLRPGESTIRLEYSLDYSDPLELTKVLDQPARNMFLITPGQGVQLSGENLESAGNEPTTGFAAYRASPADNQLRLIISGQAQPSEPGTEGAGIGEAGSLEPIPDAVSKHRWIVLSAFGMVMLAGFYYLYTR